MYTESGTKWNTESRVCCFILYVWYGLEVRVLVLDINIFAVREPRLKRLDVRDTFKDTS